MLLALQNCFHSYLPGYQAHERIIVVRVAPTLLPRVAYSVCVFGEVDASIAAAAAAAVVVFVWDFCGDMLSLEKASNRRISCMLTQVAAVYDM